MSKNKPTPKEEDDFLRSYIDKVHWKTAKSYSKTAPHQYTVWEWEEDLYDEFVRAVTIIRKYGYPERYYRKIHYYYEVDGQKYWTMGNPIEKTKLINRADLDAVYGSQHPIDDLPYEPPF